MQGCTSCGGGSAVSPSQNNYSQSDVASENCPYTNQMLISFRDALIWFKDRGLHLKHNISSSKMNKYIGIVLSSLNFNNKCRYEGQLNEISDVVDLIISVQNE